MFTNKIKKYFSALAVATLGIVSLASCSKPEYKVEFMIQDDKNAWTVLEEKQTVNQAVTLPEAPAKTYYNFSGWYDGEDLATKFVETKVEKDSKAYAKYVPEEVNIHFNKDEVLTKNLIDVVKGTYMPNPGTDLTFDGWYKDANYSVKWNGTDTVKDLYAQSVAVITFNNGYEDVYTQFVKPGATIKSPAETTVVVEEKETTLEKTEIVETYMSPKNVKYVNEEGKPFDFTQAIDKNTTITVNWNSVDLGSIRKHTKTEGYYLEWGTVSDTLKTVPAVSITNEFTITETVEGEDGKNKEVDKIVNIDTIRMYGDVFPATAEKLIVGEGIKLIKGLNGIGASKMKDIELPSTLKLIDNSFSNMPLLTGIELPEGLEVVIGSFFTNTVADSDRYKTIYMGDEYNFEIAIPSTVKNLAMVPTNLKFAEGSKFYKENDRIYTDTTKGKVLISDNKHIKDSTIVIPEGVEGIQVGTYNVPFDFLKVPTTFNFVNYNEDVKNYKYYECMNDSSNVFSDNVLFDATVKDAYNLWYNPCAYTVSSYLGGANLFGAYYGGAGKVIFAGDIPASLTTGMAAYAFAGDSTGSAVMNGNVQPMTDPTLASHIIKNGLSETVVNVSLKITYTYKTEGEFNLDTFEYDIIEVEGTSVITISYEAGITEEEFVALVKAAATNAKSLENDLETYENVTVLQQYEKAVAAGKTITYSKDGKAIDFKDIKGGSLIIANI